MGWNLCIATDEARERAYALDQLGDCASADDYDAFDQEITPLSRHFSYELLRDYGDYGLLNKLLTPEEVELLRPNDIEEPERWQRRDPKRLLTILHGVRERLAQENERLPVDHILWFVDEQGKRWNGQTQITLPFGAIKLEGSQDLTIKLDGGHRDPQHRRELRKYEVRVDPDLLTQFNKEVEQIRSEHGIDGQNLVFWGAFGPQTNPLVEEPVGWIEVQPVLNFLGCRVEVKTVDTQTALQPDLDKAIERCQQTVESGDSLYWLRE